MPVPRAGTALLRRQLDDDGSGPAEPPAGLLRARLPRRPVRRRPPDRAGDQGLPGLGPHLGGQPGPLLRPPRRAGSTPPGRRGPAAAAGRGSSQLPSTSSTGGSGPDRRRPRSPPGWRPPPRARPRWCRWPRSPRSRPAPSSVANASAMAPLPVPASTATRPVPRPEPAQAPGFAEGHLDHLLGLGPGIRTRGSTCRSRSRKGQWPNTYCSGSPVARRAARARAAAAAPAGTTPGRVAPRANGEDLVDDEAGLVPRPAHHAGQLVHQRTRSRLLRAGGSGGRVPRRAGGRSRRPRRGRHCPPSSSPSSWRARLSAINASVSSSRSPASTWSSL